MAEESSKREVNKATSMEASKNYDLLVEDTREKDDTDVGSAEGLLNNMILPNASKWKIHCWFKALM